MNAQVPKVLRATLDLAPMEATAARLLAISEDALGERRLADAVAAIRRGPLCERHTLLGELAALSVGTNFLGQEWWSTERR